MSIQLANQIVACFILSSYVSCYVKPWSLGNALKYTTVGANYQKSPFARDLYSHKEL